MGQNNNMREGLVKPLWDLGVGRELGFETFEAYLETFPARVPENPNPERFDRIIAVDRRIDARQLTWLLSFTYVVGHSFVDHHKNSSNPDIAFLWCQDGARNRNKSVRTCREQFAVGEIGMTAIEGLCLLAKHPDTLRNYGMDLPGSVLVGHRDEDAINLERTGDGRLMLHWRASDWVGTHFGSASRAI